MTTAKSSIALQFFHEPLTAEDCARFNAQVGDAKGQQYWEALSVLVGLKLWAPLVAKSSAIVQVKSDSVTALQCTAKLASSSPLLNGIGAEIALVLELYDIEEIVTQHVPGKLNEVADKLSRFAQPGASQHLPPQLQDAKRRVTPKRDDAFFRSWTAAVGPSSNFVSVRAKCFTSKIINETVCGNAEPCAETPARVSSVTSFDFFVFLLRAVGLWLNDVVSICVPCKQFLQCWFPLFQHRVQVPAAPQAQRGGSWAAGGAEH